MKTKIPKFSKLFLPDVPVDARPLCMVVDYKEDGDSLRVQGRIGRVDSTAPDGFKWIYTESTDLAALDFDGWIFPNSTGGCGIKSAFRNIYCLELANAKECVAVLEFIDKQWAVLRNQFGWPESPGAALARYASIVGAELVFLRNDKAAVEFSGAAFRAWNCGEAIFQINQVVATFQEKHKPVVSMAG